MQAVTRQPCRSGVPFHTPVQNMQLDRHGMHDFRGCPTMHTRPVHGCVTIKQASDMISCWNDMVNLFVLDSA